MTELLTSEEVAEALKVSSSTVVKWARQRLIPSVRLGYKVVRYDLDAVVNALTANEKKFKRNG